MAKKKKAPPSKRPQPRSFSGVIRGSAKEVQLTAKALRKVVTDTLPELDERFVGGARPFAMYRTLGDVCWIQPQKAHCNIYFPHGHDLPDPDRLLKGTSKRFKYVSVRSPQAVDSLPIREWLVESHDLSEASLAGGLSFKDVLSKMREHCLRLPKTKETLTWGIPHFRVGEKIFSGCSEEQGRPRIGLKMEKQKSEMMMRLDGISKAPYSRPGDGWVSIDPNLFDDWDEIDDLLVESYRLIAPKKVAALLDDL